jgi:hypothetical protein
MDNPRTHLVPTLSRQIMETPIRREELPMNFSQRVGLEPASKPIQTDSMDGALRKGLWNEFDMTVLEGLRSQWPRGVDYLWSRNPPNAALFVRLWRYFFKSPLSTLPVDARQAETAAGQAQANAAMQ